MLIKFKIWKRRNPALQNSRKLQAESLRFQKQLRNWTAIMAIGALIAACFTGVYMITAIQILQQARKDSSIALDAYENSVKASQSELRPYVIVDFTKSNFHFFPTENDQKEYRYDYQIKFSNPGKTPALDFHSATSLSQEKVLSKDSEEELRRILKESSVSSAILGSSNQYIDNSIKISVPIKMFPGSKGRLNRNEKIAEFTVLSPDKTPLYLHILYEYKNINKDTTYAGHVVACLLINFEKNSAEIKSDSYNMD